VAFEMLRLFKLPYQEAFIIIIKINELSPKAWFEYSPFSIYIHKAFRIQTRQKKLKAFFQESLETSMPTPFDIQ
jgi:hypothetical protein